MEAKVATRKAVAIKAVIVAWETKVALLNLPVRQTRETAAAVTRAQAAQAHQVIVEAATGIEALPVAAQAAAAAFKRLSVDNLQAFHPEGFFVTRITLIKSNSNKH